jgi:hypothetical protein
MRPIAAREAEDMALILETLSGPEEKRGQAS